jgi:UDP:flavonoid glycosyltransferase YjiC (YdhE family)
MKVMIATFASRSHFYPMVPLAWALRSEGHDVRVVTQPSFLPVVAAAGLLCMAAGPDADLDTNWRATEVAPVAEEAWNNGEERRARRAVGMFVLVAEAMADDVLAISRNWEPDLVIFEPRAYAGQLAANVMGKPAVRHLWGTDYTIGRWDFERAVVEPLFAKHGVRAVSPAGDLTVDPCPPPLQIAAAERRVIMRYVPYNGSGMLPALGPAERPRVCVTWGTTSGKLMGGLEPVHEVLAALDGLDVQPVVAVLAEERELLGAVPPGVQVVEDAPLYLLLPHCDAVVHQGGAGTTITSLRCGTPQLIMPTIADQFLHGERVAQLGAGLCAERRFATPEQVRKCVTALLADGSYRLRALEISAESDRQPSPAAVAANLAANLANLAAPAATPAADPAASGPTTPSAS